MRRSSAPSVAGNAAKKGKFLPPFVSNKINTDNEDENSDKIKNVASKFGISLTQEEDDNCSDNSADLVTKDERSPLQPLQDHDRVDGKSCVRQTQNRKCVSSYISTTSRFMPPSKKDVGQKNYIVQNQDESVEGYSKKSNINTSGTSQAIIPKFAAKLSNKASAMTEPVVQMKKHCSSDNGSVSQSNEMYYSVVWCKASTRKHKKWEGDGVLIVSGKQVTLKDMEAKQIAKGSDYKSADIANMCDGSTLRISGKEIEVQGVINRENYLSGKCFFGSETIPSVTNTLQLPKLKSKPKAFVPHHMPKGCENKSTDTTPKPRYDPSKEGALVMPRPNKSCQWNTGKSQVVDVVVDPHISYHLRPHQRDGVTFLYECVMGLRQTPGCGAILADEMGLGKTLQCISLIWTLLKQSPVPGIPTVKKIIIITPGSLVKNWCQEFTKWLGSERIIPFAVSSNNRVDEFLIRNDPLMVISYEMFLRCIEDVQKVKFNLVICDEAHRLKNARIKTGTALSSLGIGKRILLTGTPIQNNLEEFYNLAEMAIPGILGSLAVFKKVFVQPITKSQQPDCENDDKELGSNRATELSRLTSMFCLRRTAEINKEYLPPKVEYAVFIKMSELQLKIYNHLLKSSLVRSCLSYTYNGNAHLLCIDAMKKVCNDPKLIYNKCLMNVQSDREDFFMSRDLMSVFPDDYTDESCLMHSAKLQVVDKMLRSFTLNKEKCVIISNSTKALDIIEGYCNEMNYTNVRLDGQTQIANRQNIVNRFNSKFSDIFVFLLSSKAGGVGLNLTGASKLILYDIDWNPANDMQSMARVWRDGQKREVHIYRFIITGSVEEKMYQRQVSKQALSGAVVDSVVSSSDNVEFSKRDLKDLFTLKETNTCCTHELLQCDCIKLGGVPSSERNEESHLPVNQKNTSMAELMKWEHISDLDAVYDLDEGLKSCERVSFIFRSKSS